MASTVDPTSTTSTTPSVPSLGAPVTSSSSTAGPSKANTPPPLNTSTSVDKPPQVSPPPSVTLTPATPESPTSNTVPQPLDPISGVTNPSTTSGKSADMTTSGEKDKVKGGVNAGAGDKEAEKKQTSSIPTASTSTTNPKPTPATLSKPAKPSTGAAGQKKKRKRGGFASLLLALGCLSASEFEDDEKTKAKREEVAKASSTTKPSEKVAPATKEKADVKSDAQPAGAAPKDTTVTQNGERSGATTGTTLVESGDKDVQAETAPTQRMVEDVVVAPVEPPTVPIDETAGLTSAAVQPPGSGSELLAQSHRPHPTREDSEGGAAPASNDKTSSSGYTDISSDPVSSDRDVSTSAAPTAEQTSHLDEYLEEEYEDEEDRLIAQGGLGIPVDENGHPAPLLPTLDKAHIGRKCLVLDLDETLLHSSFKMLPSADYIVPVEIESQVHNVYVIKRPGVDAFLTEMGKIYEVVVFTASLSKYADPVLDMLDPAGVVRHRLFRESCYNHKGNYVKDLSQLGRDMETVIILDNSPASYIFHPNNAVPVSTWFNDPHDTELTDLCPFLTDLATVDDIRGVLDGGL